MSVHTDPGLDVVWPPGSNKAKVAEPWKRPHSGADFVLLRSPDATTGTLSLPGVGPTMAGKMFLPRPISGWGRWPHTCNVTARRTDSCPRGAQPTCWLTGSWVDKSGCPDPTHFGAVHEGANGSDTQTNELSLYWSWTQSQPPPLQVTALLLQLGPHPSASEGRNTVAICRSRHGSEQSLSRWVGVTSRVVCKCGWHTSVSQEGTQTSFPTTWAVV